LNSNTYLFHEINDEIINKIKMVSRKDPEAILTFDDGLYSNFKYLKELKELPNKKIFFFSADIVRTSNIKPNEEFITCSSAHKKTGIQAYDSYMSIKELKIIKETDNCFLGYHGVHHSKLTFLNNTVIKTISFPNILSDRLKTITGLKNCNSFYIHEIEMMFLKIKQLFEDDFKYMAYPYNIENKYIKKIIEGIALKHDIKLTFYGKERINI